MEIKNLNYCFYEPYIQCELLNANPMGEKEMPLILNKGDLDLFI
jgi:hypothetical protein